MAENVVGFFLGKLNELLSTKLDLIQNVDIKILSLRNKLALMGAILKDTDARRRDNERIKVWVDQVRDVVFRAEDAIDRYIYEVHCRRHAGFMSSVKNFFSHARHLKIHYQLGSEIEDIRRMLQEIADSKSQFGIELEPSEWEASSIYSSAAQWQEARALQGMEETDVIGFDHHIANLVKQLTDEGREHVVVPIVGMGGLGKTTLARSVYNHADINRHFKERKAWIYVSQKYGRRELLKSIIEEFLRPNKDELEKMNETQMENKLKGYLQGKPHLLVIDDIWDGMAWNFISRALPADKKGRGIILTTRKEDVAKCVDRDATAYHIKELGDEDGWKLLCSKVFDSTLDAQIDEKMKELGAEMVRRCGGLPLAITVLGGLLSRRTKSAAEWENVLKRITYELHGREESGQSVQRVLALSYDELPYYLRSCFLYFGLFPEDFEIYVEKLVRLWVAEGFIQARGEQTMEEVAADYVDELVDRCMIQVVERNSWGRVKWCRIHDLLLDLSISQGMVEDKFLAVLAGNPPASSNAAGSAAAAPRRVAVHGGSTSGCIPVHPSFPSSLRSLLCFDAEASLSQVRLLINDVKLLRVLDLRLAYNVTMLPKQIGGLVHLRYLGFHSRGRSVDLPSSVGKLRNLQTLEVRGECFVPDAVWKIETLRHIIGGLLTMKGRSIHCNCRGNLQTLWGIEAGSRVGRFLGEFTNLRALRMDHIQSTHVPKLSGYLERLTRLNELVLEFHCIVPITVIKTVLAALESHLALYELDIYSYGSPADDLPPRPCAPLLALPKVVCSEVPCLIFQPCSRLESGEELQLPPQQCHLNLQFPPSLTRLAVGFPALFSKQEELASLSDSLPNLKILKFLDNAYVGEVIVFSPPEFTKLQELRVTGLDCLEEFAMDEGAMPSLKKLEISGCKKLNMTAYLEASEGGISVNVRADAGCDIRAGRE